MIIAESSKDVNPGRQQKMLGVVDCSKLYLRFGKLFSSSEDIYSKTKAFVKINGKTTEYFFANKIVVKYSSENQGCFLREIIFFFRIFASRKPDLSQKLNWIKETNTIWIFLQITSRVLKKF